MKQNQTAANFPKTNQQEKDATKCMGTTRWIHYKKTLQLNHPFSVPICVDKRS